MKPVLICTFLSLLSTLSFGQRVSHHFLPGLWLSAAYESDGRISPVSLPDADAETIYGYYMFSEDGTFIYNEKQRDFGAVCAEGTWRYDTVAHIFSLLFWEEQLRNNGGIETAKQRINQQYDYYVLRLTDEQLLLSSTSDSLPWALQRPVEPDPCTILNKSDEEWVAEGFVDLAGCWNECGYDHLGELVVIDEYYYVCFRGDQRFITVEPWRCPTGIDREQPPAQPIWYYDPASRLLWLGVECHWQEVFLVSRPEDSVLYLFPIHFPPRTRYFLFPKTYARRPPEQKEDR